MKKPRVYVETSVVSYLTARPARDIVIAGRQQSTQDWWAGAKERFESGTSRTPRRGHGSRRSVETPGSIRRFCARRSNLS